MCSGRRGGDEEDDGEGNENVKALLRIAKGVFLGVRLETTCTHLCLATHDTR